MADEPSEFDLFGGAPAASRTGHCADCGARFEVPASNGRPQRFCSDPCRRRQKSAQARAWAVQPDTDEPTECLGCGVSLPARDVTAGRFRRFCSPTCRVRSRRQGAAGAIPLPSTQDDLWKGSEP